MLIDISKARQMLSIPSIINVEPPVQMGQKFSYNPFWTRYLNRSLRKGFRKHSLDVLCHVNVVRVGHEIAMAAESRQYQRYFVVVESIILDVVSYPTLLSTTCKITPHTLPLPGDIAVQFCFFYIQLTSLSPRKTVISRSAFSVSRHPSHDLRLKMLLVQARSLWIPNVHVMDL
ncbi:hypothetical protein Tco_0552134 [Tanacetum coccineum]